MSYGCDPTLLAEVRKYGRFDVEGCFNCGTCTLGCDLAGDHASFPRRSTRTVLMGVRRLVIEGLEPWLCYDCGDCSRACPRETAPREGMATLRRYLASEYDWTGIASKINTSRAWYAGSLALVALLVLMLVVWYHLQVARMPLDEFGSTSMGLEHMFPTITYFTLAVILFPVLVLLTNAFRMYQLTVRGKDNIRLPLSAWLLETKVFLLHFFTQRKMRDCTQEQARWPKHLVLGIGCLTMLALKVFFLRWFQTDGIYPLYHPQRWVGYVASAFLLYGIGDIFVGRISKRSEVHKTSDFRDWNFPLLLLGTAVSGLLVHVFRYAGLALASHYAYAIHLMIAVPMLVIEMPFGKWPHMIYRPLALYFQALKERTLQEQGAPEEVRSYVGS